MTTEKEIKFPIEFLSDPVKSLALHNLGDAISKELTSKGDLGFIISFAQVTKKGEQRDTYIFSMPYGGTTIPVWRHLNEVVKFIKSDFFKEQSEPFLINNELKKGLEWELHIHLEDITFNAPMLDVLNFKFVDEGLNFTPTVN